jgi:DNA-binding transcriptional LysR family regulator
MLRKAPPLQAIEAFLIAARAESFRAAAAALALSPSAFSRRIQQLESFVGERLFDRTATTVRLTDVGARYLQEIEPAMETVRKATADLRRSKQAGKLRVATSQSFAISWLMPRLSHLFQKHGLEIELNITRSVHVLRSGEVDVAIWGGSNFADDLPSEKIIELDGVLVSAPGLINGHAPPLSLDELAGLPIISVKSVPNLWRSWLSRMEYKGADPVFVASFDTLLLMYEAAANGLGVALGVPLLTECFMRNTRLTPCGGGRAPVDSDYSLYYSSSAQRRTPVRIFADWFKSEVEQSRQAFNLWCESMPASSSRGEDLRMR